MFFHSYVTGLLITYFLTVIPNKRNHIHCTSIEDGTVSCLDVYVPWIDRQFQKHHAALAVRHFGHRGSYWRCGNTWAITQKVTDRLPQPKLLTVSLPSTVRNMGWVGLSQQIWTHVHLWIRRNHTLTGRYLVK